MSEVSTEVLKLIKELRKESTKDLIKKLGGEG